MQAIVSPSVANKKLYYVKANPVKLPSASEVSSLLAGVILTSLGKSAYVVLLVVQDSQLLLK